MKFNLKELNPGTTFFFDEDHPEEGRITLRLCSGDDLRKITKQTTKKSTIWKRGQRHEVVEQDDDKYNRLLWDYIIVDWDGIEDADGVAIPCTTENKSLLMGGSVRFAAFVGERIEQLTETMAVYQEELEKN